MCVVSNIGDYGQKMWPTPWQVPAFPFPELAKTYPLQPARPYNGPTKEQFEEFLELMRAAHKFDKATGQPGCEQEAKIGWLRDLAKHLGVDDAKLKEVFS